MQDSTSIITFFIQEDHDTISVCMSEKLPCNNTTVFAKNLDQSLIVILPDSCSIPCIWQVSYWYMAYYIDLRSQIQKGQLAPEFENYTFSCNFEMVTTIP